MLCFPFPDAINRQQIISVGGGLCGTVDYVYGSNEVLWRDRISGVVGVILAGDPVTRGIEMGAGVLAKLYPVPGPERTILIVLADSVNFNVRCVFAELRGKVKDGRIRTEWCGDVNDLDGARQQSGRKAGKSRCIVHEIPISP